MPKKQSKGLFFDTLEKVGKHRERIGAKAQKQVESTEKTTEKPPKNKNKRYTPPKKSKEQAQKELEALRKKQDERVKAVTPDTSKNTPKSSMATGGYPKPKKVL